jgi:nickel/cobalt exporter
MEQSERDKLRVLLDYWVKHNREHADEFKEWAERARESGETDVHSDIMESVEYMDKVDASLIRALGRLK